MRITSLSAWLIACTFSSSTCAFSALSKKHQRVAGSALNRSIQTTGGYIERSKSAFPLNVASTEAISVANMERGMGGRLEEAFEMAKARGEAAFVAFITAGYPRKEGTLVGELVAKYAMAFKIYQFGNFVLYFLRYGCQSTSPNLKLTSIVCLCFYVYLCMYW